MASSLHCMSSTSSCFALPHKPKFFAVKCSTSQNSVRCSFRRSQHKSLAFSSNLSISTSPIAGFWMKEVEKRAPHRLSVVCDATTTTTTTKKADSAAKRARQAEKRRIYNKSKKSEVKTRMKKVLDALDVLKKKTEAQVDEILPIEKLIGEAYSAIDKAVKSGSLHKNTGANRKSRLARRKKTVEIHHGWYTPAGSSA